jgi:predicted YcjX-like family ATPase
MRAGFDNAATIRIIRLAASNLERCGATCFVSGLVANHWARKLISKSIPRLYHAETPKLDAGVLVLAWSLAADVLESEA